MQNITTKNKLVENTTKKIRSESMQAFLMVLIPLIGFIVLSVYPIIWTFKWSFFSYNGIPSQTTFVGFDNFKRIFFQDKTYWRVWLNTLEFAAYKIPIELPLAMIIALILSKNQIKGSGFFRSVFYLPNIISAVVVGLIITSLFGYNGVVNTWLMKLSIIHEPIDWFSKKMLAMTMLVIGSIWSSFGINVMYFMAALCNVPESLYESAKLDGASPFVVFFKITLPMIVPVFSTVLLLSIIGTLSVNDYIMVVTGGAPSGSTHTVMSYLTQTFVPGFASSSTPALGYGCAMSFLTTIIFGLIALVYKKIDKKLNSVY